MDFYRVTTDNRLRYGMNCIQVSKLFGCLALVASLFSAVVLLQKLKINTDSLMITNYKTNETLFGWWVSNAKQEINDNYNTLYDITYL